MARGKWGCERAHKKKKERNSKGRNWDSGKKASAVRENNWAPPSNKLGGGTAHTPSPTHACLPQTPLSTLLA